MQEINVYKVRRWDEGQQDHYHSLIFFPNVPESYGDSVELFGVVKMKGEHRLKIEGLMEFSIDEFKGYFIGHIFKPWMMKEWLTFYYVDADGNETENIHHTDPEAENRFLSMVMGGR